MRRWLRLASKLYPAAWRGRYGAELEALLEEAAAEWGDIVDILREAIAMRFTDAKSCARFAAAIGLAGAVVAFGLSFAMPRWYLSSAVVTIAAPDFTQ
jgi:hypothetical protein